MITVLEVIKKTAEFLASKGVESPRLNAEVLVGHALGLTRMKLYLQFERTLTEQELELIRPLVRRRSQREPLQYILGYVDFSGMRIKVDSRALIPRPETEYLIELVKDRFSNNHPTTILDLGTGTGVIALALAKQFQNAHITAVDLSDGALELARDNIDTLGFASRIDLIRSSWFNEVSTMIEYDLIISNPPYLTKSEVDQAAIEVSKFEPIKALIAEEEGLSDIKIILKSAIFRLSSNGIIALETGENQHDEIKTLAKDIGYSEIESQKDLANRDRFIFLRK